MITAQTIPGQRLGLQAMTAAALIGFMALLSRFSIWLLLLTAIGAAILVAFILCPERRRVLITVLMIAVPLNIDYTFLRRPSPGGADGLILSLTDILMALLLIANLLQSRRRDKKAAFPALLLPSLALLTAYLLSMLQAADLLWSSFDLLNLIKAILFFWLLSDNIRSRRDLQFALSGLFIALIVETVLANLMTFYPQTVKWLAAAKLGVSKELIESKEYFETYYRSGGTIGNPNHLARYQGFVLPLAMVIALTERRRGMYRLALLASLIGILGILATMTRSAWLGLAISTAATLFLLMRRRLFTMRAAARIGIFCLIGLALFIIFYRPIVDRLFGPDNGSAQTRITTSKVALAILKDYPIFGCGINNYGTLLDEYWLAEDVFTRKAPVHNNYLIYAVELGLVGLAAYVMLLTAAGKRMWRAVQLRDPFLTATAIGIVAAFLAYLVEALTDKSYKECYTLLLTFWGLLALVEAMLRMDQNSRGGAGDERRATIGF
ncbi:MAG: O-antigen ligase family protein [candidate division KSB1 bacterium]|nr:O-antigen ligase family protein [candidate division KSB1 bacterium]